MTGDSGVDKGSIENAIAAFVESKTKNNELPVPWREGDPRGKLPWSNDKVNTETSVSPAQFGSSLPIIDAVFHDVEPIIPGGGEVKWKEKPSEVVVQSILEKMGDADSRKETASRKIVWGHAEEDGGDLQGNFEGEAPVTQSSGSPDERRVRELSQISKPEREGATNSYNWTQLESAAKGIVGGEDVKDWDGNLWKFSEEADASSIIGFLNRNLGNETGKRYMISDTGRIMGVKLELKGVRWIRSGEWEEVTSTRELEDIVTVVSKMAQKNKARNWVRS